MRSRLIPPFVRRPRPARPPMRRRPVFEALEKRLLLSSDLIALPPETPDDGIGLDRLVRQFADIESRRPVADGRVQPAMAVPDGAEAGRAREAGIREIIFVDSRVDDYPALIRGIVERDEATAGRLAAGEIRLAVLDAHRDGVGQISEVLSRYRGIEAVHIVSHGDDGAVTLGRTTLDAAGLERRADELRAWGEALAPDADLLFYGCDLAAGARGEAFVDAIAGLTGADVAASDDPTGGVAAGGDWRLEYRTGHIEAVNPFYGAADYGHLLKTVQAQGDSGEILEGSQRADVLIGGKGDDILRGKAGADTLTGGDGNDRLEGGRGGDRYIFADGWGQDTVVDDQGANALDLSKVKAALTLGLDADGAPFVFDGQAGSGNRITVEGKVDRIDGGQGGIDLDFGSSSLAATFTVTGQGVVEVDVAGRRFTVTHVGGIVAGKADDRFIVLQGGELAGRIDGGGGENTLSYMSDPGQPDAGDGRGSPVEIDLPSSKAAAIKGGIANLQRFVGGAGADELKADVDDRLFHGGPGDDRLSGSDRNDTRLFGDAGDDELIGKAGDDELAGGAGNDTLIGGAGNDTLIGGAGGDTYRFAAGWGRDHVVEAADGGADQLDLSEIDRDLTIELYSGAQKVVDTGSDVIEAAHVERLRLKDGIQRNYRFVLGNDWASGFDGRGAHRTLTVETVDSNGRPRPFEAAITLDLSAVTQDLRYEIGKDGIRIFALPPEGSESGIVSEFHIEAKRIASITGGRGNNRFEILDGGAITGTIGVDRQRQSAGKQNTLDYGRYGAAFDPGDIVLKQVDAPDGNRAPGIHVDVNGDPADGGFHGIDRIVLSQNADVVTVAPGAPAGVVVMSGGGGDDDLTGSDGTDVLEGGSGNDVVDGGKGDDRLSGDAGDDRLVGGEGGDTLAGGLGDDTLVGGLGDDLLRGGKGNDVLDGGAGADRLQGGGGDDVYRFSNDWGRDQVFESRNGGQDTLDFTDVTRPLTHILSDGELHTGEEVLFYQDPAQREFGDFATGKSAARVSGVNQLAVEKDGNRSEIQRLDLGEARSGTFELDYRGTRSGPIRIDQDDAATARNIADALNAGTMFGADAVVVRLAKATPGAYDIVFRRPAHADLEPLKFVSPTNIEDGQGRALSIAEGPLETRQDGRSINEVQRLRLQGLREGDRFRLVVDGRETAEIAVGATDTATAQAVEKALDAIPRFKIPKLDKGLGSVYETRVTVVDADTYEVVFASPDDRDIPELRVRQVGKWAAGAGIEVSTVRDGRASSGLEHIEKIVAASADNTFVFGDDWGLRKYTDYEPDVVTAWRNTGRELTIDTNAMLDPRANDVTRVAVVDALDPKLASGELVFSRKIVDIDTGHDRFRLPWDLEKVFQGPQTTREIRLAKFDGSLVQTTGASPVDLLLTEEGRAFDAQRKQTEFRVEEALPRETARVLLDLSFAGVAVTGIEDVLSKLPKSTKVVGHRLTLTAPQAALHEILKKGNTFTLVDDTSAPKPKRVTLTVREDVGEPVGSTASGTTIHTYTVEVERLADADRTIVQQATRLDRRLSSDDFDRGGDVVVLDGDQTAFFPAEARAGDVTIRADGRSYRFVGAVHDAANGQTRVTVAEALDDLADAKVANPGLEVVAAYAVVGADAGGDRLTVADLAKLGDVQPGSRIVVTGSSGGDKDNDGVYTVAAVDAASGSLTLEEGLKSDAIKGKVHLAYAIGETSTRSTIVLDGDLRSIFVKNQSVTIAGSKQGVNDGTVTLEDVVYDFVKDQTRLTLERSLKEIVQSAGKPAPRGVVYVFSKGQQIQSIDRGHDTLLVRGDVSGAIGAIAAGGNAAATVDVDLGGGMTTLTPESGLKAEYVAARRLVLDFSNVSQALNFEFGTDDETRATTLTVSRTAGLSLIDDVLQFGDVAEILGNLVFPERDFAKITFTRVDANTTIYGGGDTNTYKIDGKTRFDGNLIGMTGLRNPREVLNSTLARPHAALNLQFPSATVINQIDYTGLFDLLSPKQTKGGLLNYANLGDSFLGGFGPGPSLPQFEGRIEGMTGIDYGPGINLLLGAGAGGLKPPGGYTADSLRGKAGETVSSWGKGVLGDLVTARNRFSVGGNPLGALFDKAGVGDEKNAAAKLANRLVANRLPTVAPGLHLLTGKGGGDTYRFEGVWGLAAILETPDLILGGAGQPEGYDTLDLSGVQIDLDVNVYEVTTENVASFRDLFERFGQRSSDDTRVNHGIDVGTNIVIVSDALWGGDKKKPPLHPFGQGLNYIVANDIENIIGGEGRTTVHFIGGARLQGTLSTAPGGQIVLDYSEYRNDPASPGVETDLGVWDTVLLSGEEALGGLFSTPEVVADFGTTTGVLGNRLAGIDGVIEQWFGWDVPTTRLAVTNVSTIIGSTASDSLFGNARKDNTFVLTDGGNDVVDGRGRGDNGNTVSYDGAKDDVVVDLAGGRSWFAVGAGDPASRLTLDADGNEVPAPPPPDGEPRDRRDESRLDHIDNIAGGDGDDLLIGDAGDNVFYFSEGWGHDLVVTNGGEDILNFDAVSGRVHAVDTDDDHRNDFFWQGGTRENPENSVTLSQGSRKKGIGFSQEQGGSASDWEALFSPLPVTPYLLRAADEIRAAGAADALDPVALRAVASAAIDRWLGSLPERNGRPLLDGYRFDVVDLPGTALGQTGRRVVTIDETAAGIGWFIDPTPADDGEFTVAADGRLIANPDGPAAGRIDLLTVAMHEIGHALGVGHVLGPDLMAARLAPGERLLPDGATVARAAAGEPAVAGARQTLAVSDSQMLHAGLSENGFQDSLKDRFSTEIVDLFDRSLPFTDTSLADLLQIDGQSIGDMIAGRLDELAALFPETTSGAQVEVGPVENERLSLRDRGDGFHAVLKLGEVGASVTLDPGRIELPDSFLGSGLDLSVFGITGDLPALQVGRELRLDFDFGLDDNGDFYIADPGISADLHLGDGALTVVDIERAGQRILLDGDQTARITAGELTTIESSAGGANDGDYIVDRVAFDAATGRTTLWLRSGLSDPSALGTVVADDDARLGIVSAIDDGDALVVDGDARADYTAGGGLWLSGSSGNDGLYTIRDIVYDAGTGTSRIVVDGEIVAATADGRVRPTFDGSLHLGPLAMQLDDAVIGFQASAFAGIQGRFSGFADDDPLARADSVHGLGPDGDFVVRLPLALSTPLSGLEFRPVELYAGSDLGLPAPADLPQMFLQMASLFPSSGDLGDLMRFNGFSLDDLLNVIEYGLDELAGQPTDDPATSQDEQGLIYKSMPLLDLSVSELLGSGGTDFVTALRDTFKDVRRSVDDLSSFESRANEELRGLFGLSASAPDPLTLRYEDSMFLFDLNIDKSYADRLDLSVDLGDYLSDTSSLPMSLSVDSHAPLDVSASASLDLGFGFDLSDVFNPELFFTDDTGLAFSLDVANAEPMSFETAIGIDDPFSPGDRIEVGLFGREGAGFLNLDARAGLREEVDGDGRYSVSELGDRLEFVADGHAELAVPLYFPTRDLPLGGSESDDDNDGWTDNTLGLRLDFGKDGFENVERAIPDIESAFDLFAMIDDPGRVLAGLEDMFSGIRDGLASRFAEIALPLVGDELDRAADFVDTTLRTRVLGIADLEEGTTRSGRLDLDAADGRYADGGLGATLLDAYHKGESTSERMIGLIKQALFDGIGPLLRVAETDADGRPAFDANGDPKLRPVESADDIELRIDGRSIAFNVLVADTIFDETIPLSFDASAPGLGLASDSGVDFRIDYLFGMGFGFAADDGLFLDTSGVTRDGAEFSLDLSATLPPGSELTARLGFLEATIRELDDRDGGSGLFGRVGFDLVDAGGDGRWSLTNRESVETVATVDADANVDLGIDVAIDVAGAPITLPHMTAGFHYDQNFFDATYSSTTGADLEIGGTPDIVFSDVTLDLGGMIGGFMKPIADKINQVIGPDTPVRRAVDLLETTIDLGVTKIRVLDLARLRMSPQAFDRVEKGVDAIKRYSDFVAAVDAASQDGELLISFGDFVVGGDLSRDPEAQVTPEDTVGKQAPSTDRGKKKDANGQLVDQPASKNQKALMKQIGTEPGSITFPLLREPTAVLGLLLGRDVDLFVYDMPDFQLSIRYDRSFPVFPGLNARLGGGISASTDLQFGFDTVGLRAWADDGFSAGDIEEIFRGFYLADLDPGGFDKPEFTLDFSIGAGASLGIGGLVEAGVDGGVRAGIALNLHDLPEPGTGGNSGLAAVYDGRLRVDELNRRFDQGPECLFDMHGELRTFLEAFLWTGVDVPLVGTVTVFEARKRFVDALLASFNHSCPDPEPPTVATLDGGALTLAYDPAGGKGPGDQAEDYKVKLAMVDHDGDAATAKVERISVTGNGYTQYFDPALVRTIRAAGTAFDDRYRFSGDLAADIEIHGGAGDDTIEFTVTREGFEHRAWGDDGDDRILGSDFDDRLDGGAGRDFIEGGLGDDLLVGGLGDDIIEAGSGGDVVWGDLAGDAVIGGRDQILAGAGDDEIHGGGGRDLIHGERGRDLIHGDDGRDVLIGGLGDDVIDGGLGNDTVQWVEGDGSDRVDGGGPADGSDDQDRLELVAAVDRTADRLVMERRADGRVLADFNGAMIDFSQIESFAVDLGEGGDEVTVHDLRGSGLETVDVNYGRGEILENVVVTEAVFLDSTPIMADGHRKVFRVDAPRATAHDDGRHTRTEEQTDRTFRRQEGGGEAVYRWLDDGEPELVQVVSADGRSSYYVQVRQGVDPTATDGYALVDHETRKRIEIQDRQRVYASTDPFDEDTVVGRSFLRQVGGDGEAVYLYLADGSPDLVEVDGRSIQRRDGVDPAATAGYTLDPYETRLLQRSRQLELPIIDPDSGEETGEKDVFITPEYGVDSQRDILRIVGSDGADEFLVSTQGDGENIAIAQTGGIDFTVTNSRSGADASGDTLVIDTGGGDDHIDASEVADDLLGRFEFLTGDGDDRITGSPFVDWIDSGLGDDTVTGGAGVDLFSDAGGADTLIERRDADFELSDAAFTVHTLSAGRLVDGEVVRDRLVAENERLDRIFERVELTAIDRSGADDLDVATASVNRFTIHDWTGTAILDGAEAGDVYDITLSGTDQGEVDSLIDVRDTGGFGLDSLTVWGTAGDDTFSFKRDIVERLSPREGDAGSGSIFAPTTDFSTDIVVRDTSIDPNLFRQRVDYLSTEDFTVHGRAGDDLFLVDDSSTELDVYGDAGDDRFFIGNVLETTFFDHPKYGTIEVVERITNGVSFPASFHGGTGDDYFEVNHNLAEISLYGDEDDDTFYLKALLVEDPKAQSNIQPSDEINVHSSEGERDTLAYLKNAPVHIFGGAGFDTLAIVGTEIDDTFVIFVEKDASGREVQRIYGAGLVVPEIESIERLLIVTGGGDDEVFLYGTLADQEIEIDTGSGNDIVHVGGPALDFDIVVPESRYTKQVHVPQPPRIETRRVLVAPEVTWYEVRWSYTAQTPFGGPIRFGPHLVRHHRDAIYRDVRVEIPQPDLVRPVVVTVPEHPVQVHVPETRRLDGIQGPVVIDGGSHFPDGDDRIVVDNRFGSSAASDVLKRHAAEVARIETDASKLVPQLEDWMDAGIAVPTVERLIQDRHQIREPGLIDALMGLRNDETHALRLPAGSLVALIDGGAIADRIDSHEVLPEQAGGGEDSLAAWLKTNLEADPERDDVVARLEALPSDASRVVMDPDTREIRVYTVRDEVLEIPAGFVVAKDVKNTRRFDSIQGFGMGFGIYYDRFTQVDVLLGNADDALTIDDTRARTTTRVYGGGGDDVFEVHDASGPLEIHGDTSPDYSEGHGGHLDELGRLLELGRAFDPESVDDIRALAVRLNEAASTGIVVDDIVERVDLDPARYEGLVMKMLREGVTQTGSTDKAGGANLLPDAGSYLDEVSRLGRLLGLAGDYRPGNLDDQRILVRRLNADFADISIPEDADAEALDAALREHSGDVWRLLKREYNTIQDGESYLDHLDRLGALLGLDHAFSPDDVADVKALATLIDDEFRLNIDVDAIRLAPTLRLDDYRAEIWDLLVGDGLVDVPSGDDRVVLRDPSGRVDAIDAPIRIDGQGGDDFLLLDDAADATADPLMLAASTIRGLDMLNGVDYQGLESLEIRLGGGSDTVDVQGTSASTRLVLGDGDERVFIASKADLGLGEDTDFLAGDLDAIHGELTIEAGLGHHRLLVSDEASLVGDRQVRLTATSILGLAPAPIHYDSDPVGDFSGGVTIWTGQGADVVDVQGSHERSDVRTTTTLNTGAGDDRIDIGLVDGEDGFFVANAGRGDDRIEARSSTLALVLFGGLGSDVIAAGAGDDIVFGDQGRVDYLDPSSGLLLARIGAGGPGDRTSDRRLAAGVVLGVQAGSGGADRIDAGDGANVVVGGAGDDVLAAGAGDDVVFGDGGEARAEGGRWRRLEAHDGLVGADSIDAGDGRNRVFGGLGDDDLTTGRDGDVVLGDEGTIEIDDLGRLAAIVDGDRIDGGTDRIDAGDGANVVVGGAGDDVLAAGAGDDVVFGDGGEARAEGGRWRRLEAHDGLVGTDSIDAGDGRNRVFGGLGDDDLTTGRDGDVVLGDEGTIEIDDLGRLAAIVDGDRIDGGADRVDAGDGANVVVGGAGDDVLAAGAGDDVVFGDGGEARAEGGRWHRLEAHDGLVGTDSIDAGDGRNRIFGGLGDDGIASGMGDSIIVGDEGRIVFEEDGRPGRLDDLDAPGSFRRIAATGPVASIAPPMAGDDRIRTAGGDNIVLAGSGNDRVQTGGGRDVVLADRGELLFEQGRIGGILTDTDDGASGDDLVHGGGGSDLLIGGGGRDRIDGGDGADLLLGDFASVDLLAGRYLSVDTLEDRRGGADSLLGGAGDDWLLGGFGADVLDGGRDDDLVVGDGGVLGYGRFGALASVETTGLFVGAGDILIGGAGHDTLLGGSGADELHGTLADDILVGDYAKVFYEGGRPRTIVTLAQGPLDITRSTMFDLYNASEARLARLDRVVMESGVDVDDGPEAASVSERPSMSAIHGMVEAGRIDRAADEGASASGAVFEGRPVRTAAATAPSRPSPETSSLDHAVPAVVEHQVVPGETLWDIARRYLGDGRLWPEIVRRNPAIDDPDVILPGEVFEIPVLGRHVLRDGETLWSVAGSRLGDPLRWPEIKALNPEIDDPRRIPAGTTIRLPSDAPGRDEAARASDDGLDSRAGLAAMLLVGATAGRRTRLYRDDGAGGLLRCGKGVDGSGAS